MKQKIKMCLENTSFCHYLRIESHALSEILSRFVVLESREVTSTLGKHLNQASRGTNILKFLLRCEALVSCFYRFGNDTAESMNFCLKNAYYVKVLIGLKTTMLRFTRFN